MRKKGYYIPDRSSLKKSPDSKLPKYVAFKEYKEIERLKEASHLGPGDTEY